MYSRPLKFLNLNGILNLKVESRKSLLFVGFDDVRKPAVVETNGQQGAACRFATQTRFHADV